MSSAQSLWDLLGSAEELTIVCHNNPDPGCLASALGLGRIAAAAGIAEYVRELDVDLDDTLATALLFGIRRETLGFLRGATAEEYTAAGYLHDAADLDLLRQLSTPSVTGATVDAIGRAIEHRVVRGSVLITQVERTSERDALPQAADYLATLEGVETAIVFGIVAGLNLQKDRNDRNDRESAPDSE